MVFINCNINNSGPIIKKIKEMWKDKTLFIDHLILAKFPNPLKNMSEEDSDEIEKTEFIYPEDSLLNLLELTQAYVSANSSSDSEESEEE